MSSRGQSVSKNFSVRQDTTGFPSMLFMQGLWGHKLHYQRFPSTFAWIFRVVLSETFYPKVFSYCEEGAQFFLSNIDFPVVHKVQHRLKVTVFDTLQIEKWMLVGIPPKNISKEWTTG